jgi:hypothetical protein
MLKDRGDIFYGARLVADARLHLGAVINGGDGELFFATMWKIIDNKVYLGYRTFDNRDIVMKGIKDFIFNFHHGLGIKKATLATFLANCAKAAIKDKTQAQYASRFAKWLGEQHEGFDFPQEFFEYMRIKYYIQKRYRKKNPDRYRRLHILERIYNQYPQLLQEVGAGKKYKDIFDCAEDLTIWERKRTVRPLALYNNPTARQTEELAEKLSVKLSKLNRRILIAKLIEIYKRDKGIDDGKLVDDA